MQMNERADTSSVRGNASLTSRARISRWRYQEAGWRCRILSGDQGFMPLGVGAIDYEYLD